MLTFTEIKMTTKTIETKYRGRRFLIDIVESEGRIEAWLYMAEMGVKDYMFGFLKANHPDADFLDIIKANFAGCAKDYITDHCY